MTFGQRLRELREARGIGLRELARASGLSLSHLQYIEKDERRPGEETLSRIARCFEDLSVSDLVEERDRRRLETDITVLLKEAREKRPMTDDERQHLLAVARELLEGDPI